MVSEETFYRVMTLFEVHPAISQRDVAERIGISLGTVNSCVKELIGNGWLEAVQVKAGHHKAAHYYLLTPRGHTEKARLAMRRLATKVREYKRLKTEIAQMRREARNRSRPVRVR
jgi:EPS-associated MarR family transcriptional regulator